MKNYLTLIALCLSVIISNQGYAADQESFGGWLMSFDRAKGVKPVSNEAYKEECGSCHFAYPPGLLPEKSWVKLLNTTALEDHFGENAELEDDTLSQILTYAKNNSADKSYYKRARKIDYATKQDNAAPLRITEVSYIKRKHHEIPDKLIKGNDKVLSLSNCNACHTKAEKGIFDDETVLIPNHGPWDD